MRKLVSVVLIALLICGLSGLAIAGKISQDGTSKGQITDWNFVGPTVTVDGNEGTVTTTAVSADMVVTGSVLGRRYVELVTTSDTLTAADSGKVFVYYGTINSVFTLPAATTSGVDYTFISGASTAAQNAQLVKLDPASTADKFQYLQMSTGDALLNPSSRASGDSVNIISGGNNIWYVGAMDGTWQDGD